MILRDTEHAKAYKLMLEHVDMCYEMYHNKGTPTAWDEYMRAETATAEFAHKHEDLIFED